LRARGCSLEGGSVLRKIELGEDANKMM